MTRQLIAHNNPHRYVQVMQYDFGNSDTKFDIHDYEYTQELKDLLSSIPVAVDIPEYEIEAKEAIYQHTLLEHIGTRGRSMINASTGLSKYTRGFLENTRSNNVALGMLTKFVGDYTEGREFVPPTEPLFSAENGEILINDRVLMDVGVYANIDTVIELIPGVIEIEFFEGIQDIMGELYTGGNRDFEGGVIRYFFENNDISIHPDITDWQLEQVFTINSVYNSQYDYDLMVDYVLPYGIAFAQNGASVRSLLSNPLQMRAAVEIMRGAEYTIRELMSVLMLSDALDVSYEQERWLINNKEEAKMLYNYYAEVNDAGNWSDEEIIFITNALNVLMTNIDVNPLVGADCRSFEYAKPPGALQRGCAVKDFNHTFYTAGIRSNGSPYLGDIYVPMDIGYFTMPNWMTNGQAANVTAAAVNEALKATDIYFYRNPDVSKFDLADFFQNMIKAELKIVGGSFSLTIEPFPIPSPAPYIP